MIAPAGTRSLVADLVAAGVPAFVRLDALAGDFDVGRGDPARLAGRAPDWIADAAAVHAYEVLEAEQRPPAPAVTPRRVLAGPPSATQRDVLAAIRRLIAAGATVTARAILAEAKLAPARWPDVLRGLEDRAFADVLPGDPPIVVLGPRAYLYPDQVVPRTQRSHEIERHLRAGMEPEDVRAQVTPPATRQEVLRVRAQHCPDLPSLRPIFHRTGDAHARVVAGYLAGERSPTNLASAAGVSLTRVSQILDNARRRGELPEEGA